MYTHPSTYWTKFFMQNATEQRIDWNLEPKLSDGQRARILKSLQAWQLGETSEAKHLIAAAKKYAMRTNDFVFPIAIELFIKEEQKHGENLGKYLDRIGEKRIKKDWGDSLFRLVRGLNTSMEMWTLTVLTIENAAQLFYQSLKDATGCPLLKQICDDILVDEAPHIDFQAERMLAIYRSHHWTVKPIYFAFYRFFYFSTASVVWFGHNNVLSIGSPTYAVFMKEMGKKFNATFGEVKKEAQSPTSLVPMR